MAFAKVLELSASSTQSFDDAVKAGIAKASETVRGIRGAWVKEMKVVVENGKVTEYRVYLKISFVLD